MNDEQFELLAGFLRSRGQSREGCRLVLVDGFRQCDAARTLDVSPTLIAVSLRSYKKAYADIKRLFT